MQERRLSFLLISPLLTLCLGGWILTTALHQTIGQPEQTKNLVHQSGLYKAVIPSQIAQIQKDNSSLSGLPLDNPKVQKALADSLDSQKVQAQGDQAIDGLYDWLEGKTAKPQFSINAMPDRQTLAQNVGEVAYEYAVKLPVCTSLADIPTDLATNPLAAKCLPPGVSAETVRQLVEGEVTTNPVLLSSNGTITSNDIKLSNGKPVLDSFGSAPKWYHWAQLLPKILGIAALVCMLLLLLILRPRRGIKSIGKHLLVVGITLAVLAAVIAWGIDWAFHHYIPANINPDTNDALLKLTSLFDAAYRNNIIRLSAYAAGAGLVLYILGLALLKVHNHAAAPVPTKKTTTAIEPESLEAAPRETSFTPAGPPALPTTAAVKAKRVSSKATTKKKATAHKPSSRRKKKK